MIIIDNDKYDLLQRMVLAQKIDGRNVEEPKSFDRVLELLSREYQEKVKVELKVELTPNQIHLADKVYLPSYGMYTLFIAFKEVTTQIALWDDIGKVIEIPKTFWPPFSVHVKLDTPKEVEWGGAMSTIPYDIVQYWPWGYDLERNVQIWKKI